MDPLIPHVVLGAAVLLGLAGLAWKIVLQHRGPSQ